MPARAIRIYPLVKRRDFSLCWKLRIQVDFRSDNYLFLVNLFCTFANNEYRICGKHCFALVSQGFTIGSFRQREGDDFTLIVSQIPTGFVTSVLSGKDHIFKNCWNAIGYELVMRDGTTYEMDGLGRTTKMIDPSGLNEIKFNYSLLQLNYIEDSMGRRIKFSYDHTFLWPRISEIRVESDPYERVITYDVGLDALLNATWDAGGRKSSYEYDLNILFGGEAGFKVNILNVLVNIVGGPIAGLANSIFGQDDIELFAGLQAQLVFALEEMEAPGQGLVRISYDIPTIIHGSCDVNWFLFIPTSVTFSINLQQRLLADRVRVYDGPGGSLLQDTRFNYDIGY